MKHQSKEIHRTEEPDRELAPSALGEDCLVGVLYGLRGEAEDGHLTDKQNCPGKLAEAHVGT